MKSSELDLGIVPEKKTGMDTCCPPPCMPDMDKPRYPEMTFRGKHAEMFHEKFGPFDTEDEYTVTVRLKVKGFEKGEGEYNNRVEFNVCSIIGDMVEEESSEKDEEKPSKTVRRKLARSGNKGQAEDNESKTY